MKIAHLIMVHKEPAQVERLIKKLAHKNFDLYIHLDKKSNFNQFAYLTSFPNVFFTAARLSINWGGFNFAASIIKCTEEILKKEANYSFVNLISGQDYPLQSADHIYNFFEANSDKSFMAHEAEGSEWWSHARQRIEKYHMTNFNFKGKYLVQLIINKILPKRKFPLALTLYGHQCGSWWSLNRDCAAYIVNFFNGDKRLQRFCNFTWAADEFLLATILMNSRLKNNVINNDIRYIDWSAGGGHPKIFSSRDFTALKNSNDLFARKFDIKTDAIILDQIDRLIEERNKNYTLHPV